MIYSAVHTGAKSQLGGLYGGLLANTYQPCTPVLVNKAATTPTSKGINIDTNNFMLQSTKSIH